MNERNFILLETQFLSFFASRRPHEVHRKGEWNKEITPLYFEMFGISRLTKSRDNLVSFLDFVAIAEASFAGLPQRQGCSPLPRTFETKCNLKESKEFNPISNRIIHKMKLSSIVSFSLETCLAINEME